MAFHYKLDFIFRNVKFASIAATVVKGDRDGRGFLVWH